MFTKPLPDTEQINWSFNLPIGSCLVSGTAEADRCIKAAQDGKVRTLLKHFLSEPFKFLSPDGRGGLTPYFCFLDW